MKTLILRIIDFIMSPLTYFVSKYFKFVRFKGVSRMIFSRAIFRRVGVFPITNHYYDPMPDVMKLKLLNKPDFNLSINIDYKKIFSFIEKFKYVSEVQNINFDNLLNDNQETKFPFFLPQEAELYYLFIRNLKPKKIIEIGSGFSTKVALLALKANQLENPQQNNELICIEPYENKWLEKTSAKIIREKVEECTIDLFKELNENDILFIDSSHQIKPEGDILYIYLQILPNLNSGVFINIHDIFYPRNYPSKWIVDAHSFWNEQYLLEAFLSYNEKFEIILPQNHLFKDYEEKMKEFFITANLYSEYNRDACSFWIRKR